MYINQLSCETHTFSIPISVLHVAWLQKQKDVYTLHVHGYAFFSPHVFCCLKKLRSIDIFLVQGTISHGKPEAKMGFSNHQNMKNKHLPFLVARTDIRILNPYKSNHLLRLVSWNLNTMRFVSVILCPNQSFSGNMTVDAFGSIVFKSTYKDADSWDYYIHFWFTHRSHLKIGLLT